MASVCFGFWRHGKGLKLWTKSPPGFALGAFSFQVSVCCQCLFSSIPHSLKNAIITSLSLWQALGIAGASQIVPRVQLPFKIVEPADDTRPIAKDSGMRDESRLGPVPASAWQPQCPMDFRGEADAPRDGRAYGMQRITRHPTLFSFGAFAMGTGFGTPYAAQMVMFTMPVIWTVIGASHIDARLRRGSGGTLSAEREAETSMLPFLALIEGRQSWAKLSEEVKWSNVGLAVAFAAILAARRGRRL